MATLFADLVRDATRLVRSEFELARTELGEKADKVSGAIVLLIVGGLVSFAAVTAALRTLVFLLSPLIGEAVAGLIVGGGVLLVGLLLILWGRRSMRARALAPRRTLHTLRHEEQHR